MSYVTRNLVPGETLIYQTRHHWSVLLGPLFLAIPLAAVGAASLAEWAALKNGKSLIATNMDLPPEAFVIAGVILLVIAIAILAYGMAKRNATEMAVTTRRVLIKTGMSSRRTLDLMLTRVESIAVQETFWGRVLGYGSVVVRGTGGTPEEFLKIAHPQEFRRAVQSQIAEDQTGKVPATKV